MKQENIAGNGEGKDDGKEVLPDSTDDELAGSENAYWDGKVKEEVASGKFGMLVGA